jgi:predicted nicotinamide N-methyase
LYIDQIKDVAYTWGNPTANITAHLQELNDRKGDGNDDDNNSKAKFDYVIMADCIFNRSEHRKLLWTVKETLSDSGVAICSFR